MNNNTLALSQLSFIPHSCLTYCTKITFIWLMLAWKTLNLFWEIKHIMYPTSRHDLICSIWIFGRFSRWETDFHMKQISNTKNNFFQLYWHATRTKYIQCFQCHANWLIDFKQFLEHNAKMKYVTHKKFMTENIYVKWCGKRSQKKIEDSQFKLQCSVEKLCDHGALLLSKTMYPIIIYVWMWVWVWTWFRLYAWKSLQF